MEEVVNFLHEDYVLPRKCFCLDGGKVYFQGILFTSMAPGIGGADGPPAASAEGKISI